MDKFENKYYTLCAVVISVLQDHYTPRRDVPDAQKLHGYETRQENASGRKLSDYSFLWSLARMMKT